MPFAVNHSVVDAPIFAFVERSERKPFPGYAIGSISDTNRVVANWLSESMPMDEKRDVWVLMYDIIGQYVVICVCM